MNTLSHRGLGLLLALWVASTGALSAQIVALRGAVTGAFGAFTDEYAVGTPVFVDIDLSPPLEDQLPELPEVGLFLQRPIALRIGSDPLPVDRWPHEVWILRGAGPRGLMVGAFWPALAADQPRVVTLSLLGDTELILSDSQLPAGIPITAFDERAGEYRTSTGRVTWSLDGYEIEAAVPAGAVPEPGTYGILAMALLLGLALARRGRTQRR